MNNMNKLPGCAILVLNWNGASSLRMCLPSVIEAAAVVGAEVWVVDNASVDDSAELIASQFPSVRFEALGVNKSLAGYNRAASVCDKEVIVCLDNDVLVEKDFLPSLLTHFDERPDVFAVTSQICVYPPDAGKTHAEATDVVWSGGMLRRGQTRDTSTQAVPIFYNCGCATARNRAKFLEIGGFDELFFPLYHEDIDLSWRAWKHGWTCLYEPASVVYHACGTSLGRSQKVRTLMLRNEFLFHWKNLTTPSFIAFHIASILPRLLVALARGDKARLLGFMQAVKHSPSALRRRYAVNALSVRGDAEVVRLINGLSS